MALDVFKIPTDDSTSSIWIEWHKGLVARYGRAEANITFESAWNKSGTDSANDESLRKYLKSQKYELEANFGDDFWDFVATPYRTSRTIFWLTIGLIVLIVIGMLYAVIKNPQGASKLALAGATGSTAPLLM